MTENIHVQVDLFETPRGSLKDMREMREDMRVGEVLGSRTEEIVEVPVEIV